jgi:hypothetical protein
MLDQFKDYYKKAKMNQERLHQGVKWTEAQINDDLVWNVPIYDVVNRRFAAFSSFPEAIHRKEDDPKANGKYFLGLGDNLSDDNFIKMCYLFRLCGSGINYKPKKKEEAPFGSHGFGNFWVVDEMRKGRSLCEDWIRLIPDNKFCDVKGYLLPMIKGGLNKFIKTESENLMRHLIEHIKSNEKLGIKEVVDYGNAWLLNGGFKRQNFVLTAFAMDMAEYFPDNVDRDSDVYVGSNARKCLKLILPEMKTDAALRHLCDITGGHSKPYDMEDVACDFIRYVDNFQSEHHIKFNNNIKYFNNVCK